MDRLQIVAHELLVEGKLRSATLVRLGGPKARRAGTIVEDIYASEAVVGPMSRVGRIFAGRVTLEQGSAAEQVTYTDELKVDFGAAVSEPAKKVEKLPDPPL